MFPRVKVAQGAYYSQGKIHFMVDSQTLLFSVKRHTKTPSACSDMKCGYGRHITKAFVSAVVAVVVTNTTTILPPTTTSLLPLLHSRKRRINVATLGS